MTPPLRGRSRIHSERHRAAPKTADGARPGKPEFWTYDGTDEVQLDLAEFRRARRPAAATQRDINGSTGKPETIYKIEDLPCALVRG
ncbi:MAG: hypothetical protein WAR24_19645 [Candidatus Acidiferrales bacterium]